MVSREDLSDQLFQRKRSRPPAGFAESELGLFIPDRSRQQIAQRERKFPFDDGVNAAVVAVLQGARHSGNPHLPGDIDLQKHESGLFVVGQKRLGVVPTNSQIESAADYTYDPAQLATNHDNKKETLSWAEVVALQENPLQFLVKCCRTAAFETENSSLENIAVYFEYFIKLAHILEMARQVIAVIQKNGYGLEADKQTIKLELLPALITSFMEHHQFNSENANTFVLISSALEQIDSVVDSSYFAKNQEVRMELASYRESMDKELLEVQAFYVSTLNPNESDAQLRRVSAESFEIIHREWLTILSQPHIQPQALHTLELYISRFVNDYRHVVSKVKVDERDAEKPANEISIDHMLSDTSAVAEGYAEILCSGLHAGHEMTANRHALYDILLQLDFKNLHWKTKENLCKKMIEYGDQNHILATSLVIQLGINNRESPLVMMLDSERQNLLDDLSASPEELLKNYPALVERANKMLIISPIRQDLSARRGQIGYEIEFYLKSKQLSSVPSGYEVARDIIPAYEIKPTGLESKQGYTNGHLAKFADAALWYRDNVDGSTPDNALHIHLDVEHHPSSNDLFFAGLFRGRSNNKPEHLGPTTEIRNIPLPRNGQLLNLRTISTLFELLTSKNEATFSTPIGIPEFSSQNKVDSFMTEINLNSLFFAHVCATSSNPETRLAALALSSNTELVKSLMSPRQFHFLLFTLSYSFIEALNAQNFPSEYWVALQHIKILTHDLMTNRDVTYDDLQLYFFSEVDGTFRKPLLQMLSYLTGEKLQLLLSFLTTENASAYYLEEILNNPDEYAKEYFRSAFVAIMSEGPTIVIRQFRDQIKKCIQNCNTEYLDEIIIFSDNPNFPVKALPSLVERIMLSPGSFNLDVAWKIFKRYTANMAGDYDQEYRSILNYVIALSEHEDGCSALIDYIDTQNSTVKIQSLSCMGESANKNILAYLLSYCQITEVSARNSELVHSALTGLTNAIEDGKVDNPDRNEIIAVVRALLYSCQDDRQAIFKPEVYSKAFSVYALLLGSKAVPESVEYILGTRSGIAKDVQHLLKNRAIAFLLSEVSGDDPLLAGRVESVALSPDSEEKNVLTNKAVLLQAITTPFVYEDLKNRVLLHFSKDSIDSDMVNAIDKLLESSQIPDAVVDVIAAILKNTRDKTRIGSFAIDKSELLEKLIRLLESSKIGNSQGKYVIIDLLATYWISDENSEVLSVEQKERLLVALLRNDDVLVNEVESRRLVFDIAPKIFSKEDQLKLFYANVNTFRISSQFLEELFVKLTLSTEDKEAFLCQMFKIKLDDDSYDMLEVYCANNLDDEANSRIFWDVLWHPRENSFGNILIMKMLQKVRNRTQAEMSSVITHLYQKTGRSKRQFIKLFVTNRLVSPSISFSSVECVKQLLRSSLNKENIGEFIYNVLDYSIYNNQGEYESLVAAVFEFAQESRNPHLLASSIGSFDFDYGPQGANNLTPLLFSAYRSLHELGAREMLDSDQSLSLWIQFFKRELYYNFPTEDVTAVEDLSVFLCSRDRLITHASMLKLESFLTFLYDANLMQIAERVCEQFIEYVHAYQPDISNSIDFLERFAASTTLTPKIKMQLIEIVDEARKRE